MNLALTVSRLVVLLAAALPARAQEAGAPRNGTVSGCVLGPLGQPIPNIEVIATANPYEQDILAKTRTDAEGMFVMARLPTGSPCYLIAAMAGYTTGAALPWFAADETDVAVQIRLWEANTLRGRVLDAAGKPVAGAVVFAAKDFARFESPYMPPEVVADAEGRFELKGVPIGDCVIRAWAPGFMMCEHALSAVADATVDVTLARGEGVTLAITTDGLPAEVRKATRVRLSPVRRSEGFQFPNTIGNNQLDGAGRLTLAGLPDVEWRVTLSVPRFTFDPPAAVVKAGSRVHTLPFRASPDREVVLRGLLRGTEGKPLPAETLLCRSYRLIEGLGQAITGTDGRFELRAFLGAEEPYYLQLAGSRQVLQQERPAGLEGADLRDRGRWREKADAGRELTLVAAPAAFVSGRLVDAERLTVPFVSMELQGLRSGVQPPWGQMAGATSMRDGTFRLPGVVALDIDLRVCAAGTSGAGASPVFQMRAGETKTIEVTVERPGVIEGRVLDAAGKPLVGIPVSRGSPDAMQSGGKTTVCSDRQGRFVFTGVAPAGHYVFTDNHNPTGHARSELLNVAAGATVKTVLQLQ